MAQAHHVSIVFPIAVALFAITAAPADAEDVASMPVLKVSTALGPAYSLGAVATQWAKRIGERAPGRLGAKVYPGAALAQRDPTREFAALRDSKADLAVGSSLYWSTEVPALGVASLPWLAPEPAQVEALVKSPVMAAWTSALDKAGVVPLAYAPLAHHAVASRGRAIATPADLAGAKVRISHVPLLTSLYAAFAAQPMTMTFSDSQSAMASGALDLQDGTPASFAGAALGAVGAKHVTLWGATAQVAIFAANRDRWEALTEADRAMLQETAEEAARDLALKAREENDLAQIALRRSGIRMARLSEAERAPFAAAARGTYDKLAATLDPTLVRAAEDAVKAAH
jgi:TRAP-type C4-dicarboxylate transport system substrate-binding protein